MREFIPFIVFGLLCFLILGFVILLEKYSCEKSSQMMGMNWSFSIATGCMIEHQPGKWIKIEQFRVIE